MPEPTMIPTITASPSAVPRVRRRRGGSSTAVGPSAPDGVVVTVELAGGPGVELDGPDRLVARGAQAGQHLQHLVFPDVDGHGERDARLPAQRLLARRAHAVGGGGED